VLYWKGHGPVGRAAYHARRWLAHVRRYQSCESLTIDGLAVKRFEPQTEHNRSAL